MGARGRQSKRDKEVEAQPPALPVDVETATEFEVFDRPPPPAGLTEGQATTWRVIVDSEPAAWFTPSTLPLLRQYCIHVSRARRIANLLNAMEQAEQVDLDEYAKLLRAEDLQTSALARLATKMRLSQQSTYDRQKAKPAKTPRSWDY